MVRIRVATPADARLLWIWANDPVVRGNSLSPEAILWPAHQDWLARKLASPDTRIYLLEDDTKVIGQIRYDREGDIALIDVSIVREERGKAYGKELLKATMERACRELGVGALVALVKPSNDVSARLFAGEGFEITGEVREKGVLCRRFVYRRADPGP